MGRKVRLVCMILLVLYICGRMPFPLLVIPLIGCTVVWATNEVKEIRNDGKKKRKRNKKVTKKSSNS